MVFSSTVFLFLFLPLVLATSAASPRGLRNPVLLGWSLLFYAWGEGAFVLLMLASIAANWALGLAIAARQTRGPGHRAGGAPLVAAAVVVNLGLLVAFKYANFLVDNLNLLLGALHLPTVALAPVHLPIGVSFFTFQALSYVIDVHRRDAPVQRDPRDLALYVSLFPQLIAGPIVRYRDVAAQIAQRTIDLEGFAVGVRRFVIGLGKKVLIANAVAVPADRVFGLPAEELGAGLAWFGAACYALQIYFDFSGYSDMAIGLGRMFGFRFHENFAYPYVARSITGFWRRWHISLSTWFRDYLYIPMGGSRGSRARTARNLVAVFLLCGLWHGAAWTFVLWGLWHGAFLVLERTTGTRAIAREAAGGDAGGASVVGIFLRHAYVLAVVSVGWVLFRADSAAHAAAVLRAMSGLATPGADALAPLDLIDGALAVALAAGVVGSTPWAPWLGRRLRVARATGGSAFAVAVTAAVENAALAAVFALSAASLAAGTHNPFIYFRF